MKIVETTGCICDGIKIDGRDIDDFSKDELKDIVVKLVDRLYQAKDARFLRDMISDIVNCCGNYEYLYTCDDCGDSVYDITLEI